MEAESVGILQSLVSTCRLHGIYPYTWLVNVLQRISVLPARDVAQLTSRLWKDHFADKPMISDVRKPETWPPNNSCKFIRKSQCAGHRQASRAGMTCSGRLIAIDGFV